MQGHFKPWQGAEEPRITANQVQLEGKGEGGALNHVSEHGGTKGEPISVQNMNPNCAIQFTSPCNDQSCPQHKGTNRMTPREIAKPDAVMSVSVFHS